MTKSTPEQIKKLWFLVEADQMQNRAIGGDEEPLVKNVTAVCGLEWLKGVEFQEVTMATAAIFDHSEHECSDVFTINA